MNMQEKHTHLIQENAWKHTTILANWSVVVSLVIFLSLLLIVV